MILNLFKRKPKSGYEVLNKHLSNIQKSKFNNGKPFMIDVSINGNFGLGILSRHSLGSFGNIDISKDDGFVIFMYFFGDESKDQYSLSSFEGSSVYEKFNRFIDEDRLAFMTKALKESEKVLEIVTQLANEVFKINSNDKINIQRKV